MADVPWTFKAAITVCLLTKDKVRVRVRVGVRIRIRIRVKRIHPHARVARSPSSIFLFFFSQFSVNLFSGVPPFKIYTSILLGP